VVNAANARVRGDEFVGELRDGNAHGLGVSATFTALASEWCQLHFLAILSLIPPLQR